MTSARGEVMAPPECPQCASSASRVTQSGRWFGQPWERRVCLFCNRSWRTSATKGPPVADEDGTSGPPGGPREATSREGPRRWAWLLEPPPCPHCGHPKSRVTSTRAAERFRYRKCAECQKSFKEPAIEA